MRRLLMIEDAWLNYRSALDAPSARESYSLDMGASPNMKLFLLTTLLVLLAVVGCSRKTDNPHSGILLDAQADALAAKIVLCELREGRVTNALELLEEQIDTSVIMIQGSLPKVSGSEREGALGTLQSLKAYRAEHPRQQEAVIPDVDNEEMTRKASRILSELE